MVVTHADLSPSPKGSGLHGRLGAFLMVLSILLGLFCFILCLIAESSRSQVKWDSARSECTYTGSGKLPILSAAAAFSALAVAAAVQHAYLLVGFCKSDSPVELSWNSDSVDARTFMWEAGFFFVSTWSSFAVGEVLLLVGLCVESGHIHNWKTPRASCLVNGPGLFTAAGVFGLLTVFLASGLYITALRIEMYFQEQENMSRQTLGATAMYASSPIRNTRDVHGGETLPRLDQNVPTTEPYLRDFDKNSSAV